MPIECTMLDPSQPKPQVVAEPGDMWHDLYADKLLSRQYKEQHKGDRPPLFVCLPNKRVFCLDSKAENASDGGGWTVKGEPPNVTVEPSILVERGPRGGYHGYLRDGVLTDDVEGRTYDN